MRTYFPNLDRDDALETVLEVPIPEEMCIFNKQKSWQKNMKSWVVRPQVDRTASLFGGRGPELQFLLGVIGAPLIPLPIQCHRSSSQHDHDNIKGHSIESSIARYIIKQYIAASGGDHALDSIQSMYAMGKVKMTASEFLAGEDLSNTNSKVMKSKSMKGPGEIGGFVLWQKSPDLWNFELMISGCKISAGSDGKVAWRQTPWQHSHASRGPPRPLRRSLQGLDPRSTADLFSNSICIGEKTINNEDCFVLKLESEPCTLTARSSSNVEIIRHTVWGNFSQKTGLLVQLEDSHLLRIKGTKNDVFWETTMESLIQDYKTIDGVNIAHSGRTCVSLFRFGENKERHTRTRMEEVWSIEEVDFNIKGLSNDFFLPPGDLKKEDEDCGLTGGNGDILKNGGYSYKVLAELPKISSGKGSGKVVAFDEETSELFGIDEEL